MNRSLPSQHPLANPLLPGPDKNWRPQFVTVPTMVEVYPDEYDVELLGMRAALENTRAIFTGFNLMSVAWVRHR